MKVRSYMYMGKEGSPVFVESIFHSIHDYENSKYNSNNHALNTALLGEQGQVHIYNNK